MPSDSSGLPERARQELHRMSDLDGQSLRVTMTGDLHRAARIGGGHDRRAGLPDTLGLAPTQLGRQLGLEHIVDSGASAAEVGVAQVYEGESRNPPEARARLGPYPLAMGQVARVVIGDGERQLTERQV